MASYFHWYDYTTEQILNLVADSFGAAPEHRVQNWTKMMFFADNGRPFFAKATDTGRYVNVHSIDNGAKYEVVITVDDLLAN